MFCMEVSNFHEAWDEYLVMLTSMAAGTWKGQQNEAFVVAPRGMKTWELLGQTFRIQDLRNNILVNSGRDLNYKFMVAEFLWIAFGMDEVETLARYNKEMRKFSDDGQTLYGAYGKRLSPQWERITRCFLRDTNSRQAVGVIFNSDMSEGTKDTPCTISLQWLLRDNRLNCIATMRSSDIWLGLPYDVYTFSQLTNSLAGDLHVEPGWLQMQLGSLHLYENNLKQALSAKIDYQSYTLRSQELPCFPIFQLKAALESPVPIVVEDPPWDTLAKVLGQQTKVQALGVFKNAQTIPR